MPERVMLTAMAAKKYQVFRCTAVLWQTKAFGSLILQPFLTYIYLRCRIFLQIENENHTSSSRLSLFLSRYIIYIVCINHPEVVLRRGGR